MALPNLRRAGALTAVAATALACGFFGTATPQSGGLPGVVSPSPEVVPSSTGNGASDVMEELTDSRVEGTLALRSVQMELQTVFPGEAPNRILVSVDASGNQRIEMTTPVSEESALTPEPPDWNVNEIFVVDGKAYTRMGKTGSAEPDPEQNDALSEILYNPSGPGMWLILLPEESFTSAGKETKGGFDATKFTVDSSLEGDAIKGEFWVDEQTGALVGANLSLAESIFDSTVEGTGGWVTIDFTVEKEDVPAIAVPLG
jgi:hypothetical protein